jgi:membrane-bound lytic murein transglycosylase D
MNQLRSKKRALCAAGIAVALLFVSGCASLPQEPTVSPDTAATPAPATLAAAGSTAAGTPAAATVARTPTKATLPAPAAATTSAAAIDTTADSDSNTADSDTNEETTDLWDRIRAGYGLPALDSPYTARHEQWFASNPEYMENMVARARLYLYYIVEEVEKRGMPMEIALLPAIESAYQPHAYSRARAVGLWQFISSTGRLYGLKDNWWYDGRRDVIASTQAALDYLEKLNKEFNGDWQLTLAAYNCGEGKVARLIEQNRRRGLSTAYQDLKLPRETKNYVPKLMAMANIVSHPEQFGLKFASIPDEPYFTQVDIGSQVDLGVIAKLTDMPVADLYQINPEYVRWITDPKGPHQLLVPTDKKDVLLAGLSTLPEEERVKWLHHEVRRGDTISHIARRYGVTIEAIKTSNQLHGNLMRVGQDLLIPVSTSKVAVVAPATPATRRANAASGHVASVNGHTGKVRITHRVRSGETLWSIARRYNVYIRELRQWNLLEAGDVLHMGQKLHIWTRSS